MMDTWIDGELSPDKRTVFEHHLTNCMDCSAQAEDLRRLTVLLGTRPPARPSAGLKKKTLSLFIEETGSRRVVPSWSSLSWGMYGAMTASVLIGLGVGCKLGTGWTYSQLLDQYSISGFLFSAGDLLSSWV
nr:hypothetical protein [Desulfobacula sp.]